MKYSEYKDARQSEVNKLPLFFAFGNKQFEEQLAKRGIKVEDAAKHVVSIGAGGFFLRKDKPVIDAYFSKDRDAELRAMMEADLDFARDAFEYEMMNHEYPINWQGDYDVCSCFGNVEYGEEKYGREYLTELGFSEKVIAVYAKARRTVQQALEW